jgi:hypothetical protein
VSAIQKIVAQSYERYNGGARVKRQYGSATVTKFFVEVKGDPSTRAEVVGYGKTPGDRKTHAIEQFMRMRGLAPKVEEQEVRPWGGSTVGSRVDVRPETPRQSALYQMTRDAMSLGDSMLKGFSGADRADSEKYFLQAQVYRDVAAGVPFEEAYQKADKRWRDYAAAQERKVNEAGKIKHGPMSGQSVIHYKWVSPTGFEQMKNHMAFMVSKAEEGTAAAAPSLPPGTTTGG